MFSKGCGRMFEIVETEKIRGIFMEKNPVKIENSAKNGRKPTKFFKKYAVFGDIHIGFQQLVENRFGKFPPFSQGKYGYPKALEKSCGKRIFAFGKPGRRAKKEEYARRTPEFSHKPTGFHMGESMWKTWYVSCNAVEISANQGYPQTQSAGRRLSQDRAEDDVP